MFRTRLISGIVLVILLIITMNAGGMVLLATCAFISLVGLYELYRVMKMEKTVMGIIGYIITVLWYYCVYVHATEPGDHIPYLLVLSFMTIAMLCCFVIGYPKYSAEMLFAGAFGVLYVPFMISYIFRTRAEVPLGNWFGYMIYIASWGSDTCAYCAGRLWGKHKMTPLLSPKKTVEGAVGGVAGAAILSTLFGLWMCIDRGEPYEILPAFAVIGACGALISIIGDLAASGIKRAYGVKDYGKLIPGHGGILDRFDSVIITAPIVYYLADFFMKGYMVPPMLK
ncbi:MAG: phosphatidate cytidylyltransferase [Catonella sp.]|nr:phosphatidate cytidylyltransferase [Catonella sp.]